MLRPQALKTEMNPNLVQISHTLAPLTAMITSKQTTNNHQIKPEPAIRKSWNEPNQTQIKPNFRHQLEWRITL